MKRVRPPCLSAGARQRGAGFTLLEVLLTVILSATLMAGLWSLFGTYLKLFETGQIRVEQSQLVRALMSQLSDDLSSVTLLPVKSDPDFAPEVAPPPQSSSSQSLLESPLADATPLSDSFESREPAADTGVFSNIPRLSLAGNEQMLRLEVLQSVPWHIGNLREQPRRGEVGETREPRAVELRSILYCFAAPRELSPGDREPPPGLIRRERTWEETQSSENMTGESFGAMSTLTEEERRLSLGFEPLSADGLIEREQEDDSFIWSREVVAFRFRYFDGRVWNTEWDSRKFHSLPAAVEIAFQLQTLAEVERLTTQTTAQSALEQEADPADVEAPELGGNEMLFEDLAGFDADLPIFRHVISLHDFHPSPESGNDERETPDLFGSESLQP